MGLIVSGNNDNTVTIRKTGYPNTGNRKLDNNLVGQHSSLVTHWLSVLGDHGSDPGGKRTIFEDC